MMIEMYLHKSYESAEFIKQVNVAKLSKQKKKILKNFANWTSRDTI